MIWGSEKARVDAKHRLCFSTKIRKRLQETYHSSDVFVTSLDGKEVKVFPRQEWAKMLEKLDARTTEGSAQDGKLKNSILMLANRFGAEGSLDNQGRVLVPGALREAPGIEGDVWVMWQSTHLLVMSEERYQEKTAAAEAQLSGEGLAYAENLGL